MTHGGRDLDDPENMDLLGKVIEQFHDLRDILEEFFKFSPKHQGPVRAAVEELHTQVLRA